MKMVEFISGELSYQSSAFNNARGSDHGQAMTAKTKLTVFGPSGAFNSRHLLRSFLGLTVPPGRFVHPEHRDTAEHPSRKDVHAEPVSIPRDPATASREVWSPDVYGKDAYITGSMAALVGEKSLFSFGTGADLWHALVHEFSWPWLVSLEIALEAGLIAACGVVLHIVAAIEGKDNGTSFGKKVLLSLTTVRLSTDSVYGWQESEASSPAEIFVLAAFGWLHWTVLTVAAALIVARALRPTKSIIFAPDMVVNGEGAQIRFMVVRGTGKGAPEQGMLFNLEFTAQAWNTNWAMHDVPFVRGKYAMINSYDVITLRVDTSNKDSPFHPSNVDEHGKSRVMQVMLTATATDCDGGPVIAHVCYYKTPWSDARMEEALRPYPRILFNHAFVDNYVMVKHPVTGAPPTSAPKMACDLDNFSRTKPIGGDEKFKVIGASEEEASSLGDFL